MFQYFLGCKCKRKTLLDELCISFTLKILYLGIERLLLH